jgi:Kef-type K+ transport system membrane component KefB
VRKVLVFSILLILGLVGSQVLPPRLGEAVHAYEHIVRLATVLCLAFIMIHVGLEFEIDKRNTRKYAWDAVVASTAAILPWLFLAAYFLLVLIPREHRWDIASVEGSLLSGLFAAPTSAGVLFSMLAAGGLAATWLFRKARVLAIFDDLVTVLLMIPLKMLLVGPKWQLGAVVLIMVVQLALAWRFLHRLRAPTRWFWVLGYGAAIVALCELIHLMSLQINREVPVHIEVLLPAFVLGCILKHGSDCGDPDMADPEPRPHAPSPIEQSEARASTIMSALFMVLVGLSMPMLGANAVEHADHVEGALEGGLNTIAPMPWTAIALHVLLITAISNLGKMFPALCYRREAPLRHRVALAVGMWPRGEVGAGVLVVAIGYGIGGPALTIAVVSLALNLLLTGVFIAGIKRLIAVPAHADPATITR